MRNSEERKDLLQGGLPTVLAEFRINTWDLLLVGDGSGSGWDLGCGWAVGAVDNATMRRKLLWGAWSAGTVGIAELIPYLHALLWYNARFGKSRRKRKGGLLDVHIISDNENVVNQGNRHSGRAVNAPLWAAIDTVARDGYHLHWYWVERGTLSLNILADDVSRKARLCLQGLPIATSVYDHNPLSGIPSSPERNQP